MAKKVNVEMAKRAKSLGINAKSEEELREELLKVLEKNGIDGMEEEETITLMEIAESFVEEPETTEDEDEVEEVEETEDDEEDLADEAEDEEDEVEEVDDDEEEEEEKPAKKAKKAEKPAKKAEKPSKKEEPKKAEKPAKKAVKKSERLDFKNDEKAREVLKPFKKIFPEKEYNYAWVVSAGVTIKHIGKNSQRGVATFENCSRKEDGTVVGNLFLLTFRNHCDILENEGWDYERCCTGVPVLKKISLEEAVEVLTNEKVRETIDATCQKIDKRLGDNRAKMEADIDKKASKKAVKKEESKAEKPAKKAEKKAEPEKPAKKTSKK